jgi:hypothetical protein
VSDAAPSVEMAPTADSAHAASAAQAPSVEGGAARGSRTAAAARPYPPSWLNRLIAWIERLPGPPWLAFVLIGAVSCLLGNAQGPLSGQPAAFSFAQTYFALLLSGILWLVYYLDGVARQALDTFRAVLPLSDAEVDELRYRLTVVPPRGAWILFAVAAGLTLEAYLFQAETEEVVGVSPVALAVRAPIEILTSAIVLVTLYHTALQLRLVERIQGMAKEIDLYQPAPLYAFSRLTMRTGMGIFLLFVPALLVIPASATLVDYAVVAAWFAILVTISVVAFVGPLQGMHARIEAEKQHLEAAVGSRLTATTEALHRAVDASDLSVADGLNKNLTSLIAERELLEKLPTWPWRPGTIGAFVTAILLPVGLWLVTRLLERVV